MSSTSRVAGLRSPEISDSRSAIATAANSSGTQIPSLRPLSTFSPCRIRWGTRSSVTTAWPRAASVGASTTARMTASMTVSWPKIAAAATAPRAIVSGRPIPSRRPGTPTVRRSAPRSMRDASENNTSPSVTSANARTVALELARLIPSSTSGPTSSPQATNRIVGVIGVPASRRETAATPSRASAMRASPHCLSTPPQSQSDNREPARADRTPTGRSFGQRHVRLLAVRVGRPLRPRPAGAGACDHSPKLGFRAALRRRLCPLCAMSPAPRRVVSPHTALRKIQVRSEARDLGVRRLTSGKSQARGADSVPTLHLSQYRTIPMPPHAQRVLIIDDHASFRAVTRELLERRGFEVVGEADGARAGWDTVAAVTPDAVVLDVNLPDGNGIDVCRAMTALNPALAVLLVSADPRSGRWASDCGAVAFVPKARLASADLRGLLRRDADGELTRRATG